MSKAKKVTFRQRLREKAALKLDLLEDAAVAALGEICKENQAGIKCLDLARLICGGQKTLRKRLITELANKIEDELEQIYNRQMDLPMEKTDGDE